MSAKLSLRSIRIIELPIPANTTVLYPEQIIVRFASGKIIDVGSLCYLARDFTLNKRKMLAREGKRVHLQSICADRIVHIRKLIVQISDELRHSGRREETVRDTYRRFFTFMNWADVYGWRQMLADKDNARQALSAYVAHLRERVRMMEITINSAARQQNAIVGALETYHEVDMRCGLNLLYTDLQSKESTKPPSEDTQSRALSLSEAFFDGVCDLVLVPRPFPHGVKIPEYLGWPNDTLWLFPINSLFMSSTMLAERRSQNGPMAWAYNFAHGRLSTVEELRTVNSLPGLEKFARNSDASRNKILRLTANHLAVANNDVQHYYRRVLAFHAMGMFCILFLAQTGMNWAQVVELSWSDHFEVSATHQAFRTIKWRAGGKLVAFEIPVDFIPTFKRYLALRKYLLNGSACEFLFFRQGRKGVDVPMPFKGTLDCVYKKLQRIDPSLPWVTSREWRAAKSDWLVRNTDPATAAIVLQNSEQTVLRSYAEGSESVHLSEMSNFLNEVASRVLSDNEAVVGGTPRAVGVCVSFGAPMPIATVPLQPDCRRPEGCLFCDKYKVHADAQDMRKLLSCRHCLRQTVGLAGSDEQVNALLGPIFDRIDFLLDEVRKRDAEMVERVTREVEDDGELDPYWAQKYDMLVSLGVAV